MYMTWLAEWWRTESVVSRAFGWIASLEVV